MANGSKHNASRTFLLLLVSPIATAAGPNAVRSLHPLPHPFPQSVLPTPVSPTPNLQVWGLERGFCLSTILCHSTCNSLALTPDGATIVSGHFDGALRFWDRRSGRQAHEIAGLHSQQITSAAVGLSGGGRGMSARATS